MNQAILGVLLTVFLIAFVFTLYVWMFPYRHEKRKADRYRLFAVRDKLVTLVAEGKIKEDDKIFQFLYESVNFIIPIAKPMSMRIFVASLKQQLPPDKLEVIKDSISHKEESVRAVAIEFFNAVGEIMVARSIPFRIFVAIVQIGFIGQQIYLLLSKIFTTHSEAYQLYRNTTNVAQELQCAA